MGGSLDRRAHMIDGAQGDAIKLGPQRLRAGRVNFDRKIEGTGDLTEKRRFLALRFDKGDRNLRPAESDWNAGKSGTGTEVKKCRDAARQGAGTRDALNEMAGQNALLVPDGGEVGAAVPSQQQGAVGCKPFGRGYIERGKTRSFEQFVQPHGGRIRLVSHCRVYFRR